MVKHYLKIAFRNLRKYGTQNIISMFGLSISVACFALCFYVVRSFTTMDKEFPDSNRMYTLYDSVRTYPAFAHHVGALIKRDFPDIEKATTVEFHGERLFQVGENNDRIYTLKMLEAFPSFFDFFSVSFIVSPLPDYQTRINEIVLCESAARRLFGSINAVGETLVLEKEEYDHQTQSEVIRHYTYTVCGVIRDFRKNSYFSLNLGGGGITNGIFLNDERGNLKPGNDQGWSAAKTVLMLHKNVSVDDFNKKFTNYSKDIMRQFYSEDNIRLYLYPFSKTLNRQWGTMLSVILGILGGIGLLVLLVSIFNYTSYTVNTFLNKRHECAIRKMTNAGYGHLFFLFYTETAIVIILSGLLAVCWVQLLMPFVNGLFGMFLTVDAETMYRHLIQYTVAGLALAFLLYLVPVSRISRKAVKDTLYDGKSKNPKSNIRNVMLGLQLFISVIFISGTLFMYLQLRHISSVTVSTLTEAEKENIIVADLSHKPVKPHVDNIIQKFKTNPDIEDMLIAGNQIASGGWMTSMVHDGKEIDMNLMSVMWVGSNYAEFTSTKITEGRFIAQGRFIAEGQNEIVINQTAKKLLGKENVLGEILTSYGSTLTVVGVMEDVVNSTAYDEIKAVFFMPCKEDGRRYAYIKVNPVKKKETMAYIMNTVREYLPATTGYELNNLNEIISKNSRIENMMFKLITLFSVISVIVSLFGVYSSIVLTTERRRREVAIRKINGATLWIIIKMFLQTYLYILVAAVIPAFVVVYIAINKWLETYAYRISVSWTVFAMIFLTMVCLLILTVIYQLLKTARLNPAEEIKR